MTRKIYPLISAILLLAVLSTACSANLGASSQGAGAPGTIASSGGGQESTPTASLPTLAIGAGATATAAPTAAPFKTLDDPQLNARFSYPSAWQVKSAGRVEGSDGYAWLEVRANDGAEPGAVCQGEANRDKPAKYGAYPQIIDVQAAQDPAACLILPSKDQPAERKGEAIYFVWYPPALRPNAVLALHADQAHIAAIAKSLRLDQTETASATSSTTKGKSVCDYQVSAAQAPVRQNGLRIDEFPVASGAACIPNQEAEAFNAVAAAGKPLARDQQMIARQWRSDSLTRMNASLAAFGYRLSPYDKYYAIYRNGRTVKTKLNWVGPITVNASRTDFILPVMDSYNSQIYLLRPDGIHDIGEWDILTSDRVFPVYVGDDLITPAYDYERYERQVNEPALLTIKKGEQVIDTYSVDQSTADGGPARGLWSWDGHWVLELPGMVIQDGQNQNDALGYSEMFSWRLLKNKPFYFYRKDGQIHLSFNGQEFPVTYDAVIHKPDCCTSELLQMQVFENGLTFYARRGDTWYYVVAEAGG